MERLIKALGEQAVVALLLEKIERLEMDKFFANLRNEELEKENARLNELLTPTATEDLKDE